MRFKFCILCKEKVFSIKNSYLLFIFFKREYFNSRFIVLVGSVLIVLYLVLGRVILRKIKHYLYKKGIGARNIILVGIGSNFSVLRDAINYNYKMGYRIIDTVSNFDEFEIFYKKYNGEIDEVVQTNTGHSEENNKFLNFIDKLGR